MIAAFPNQQALDAVLPLPSGVAIGIPLQGTDGRVAICHRFSEEDLTVLREAGAEIRETLPGDWQYPGDIKAGD